jgi:hypothetical protein
MKRVRAALEQPAERLDLRAAIRRHAATEQRYGQPLEASSEPLGEAGPQVAPGLRRQRHPLHHRTHRMKMVPA